jgi:hypothetical protein
MTVFETKTQIAGIYTQLLDKHEEPFRAITKSVTDLSLTTIEGRLENFCDIIKALHQSMEISMPI